MRTLVQEWSRHYAGTRPATGLAEAFGEGGGRKWRSLWIATSLCWPAEFLAMTVCKDALAGWGEIKRTGNPRAGQPCVTTLPRYFCSGRTPTRFCFKALMPLSAAKAPVIVVMRQMLWA